jgi:2-amino-4-hydroxy-6-hydroxymethyldihydropteridine diphosphokinase
MNVALSLGSNLGDRLQNLRTARARLAGLAEVRVLLGSRVYETEPVDVLPEYAANRFLNAALLVDWQSTVEQLAAECHAIEEELGRTRTVERNAPRIIDLDIIFAGALQVNSQVLSVPHPRWATRRFVLAPLADIAPDAVLPGETRTVAEVLLALPPGPEVTMFAIDWS